MNMGLLKSAPIAHRGLHGKKDDSIIPENTLIAIEEAIRKGYAIEGDIRVTKDGRLLWVHDGTLKRLTNQTVNTKVENLSEKERLKTGLLGTEHIIPTFADVLKLVDGRVPLLIELKKFKFKNETEMREIFGLISEELRIYKDKGPVYLQSFCPDIFHYKTYAEAGSDIKTGLLITPFSVATIPVYTKLVRENPYDFLAIGKEGLSNKLIVNFKQKTDGKGVVLAWTIRTKNQASMVLEKVDNIIFEGFEPNIKNNKSNLTRNR